MTHHSVSGAHRQDDCCGNPAHPACHCDAACGSLLLPALPAWPGGTALAVNYAPFHGRMAPTPPLLPPLRPPAA
ncbi:hypothetical protein GCM10007863_41360 [Dyella mobilis]|nr:hypothetical protein GCM10007863_41360 [Dyella mobilis]